MEKLQRELKNLREEWQATLDYQKYEQIRTLERQIAEAEEECMDLEHEARNATIRLEKQAKRLKEKERMVLEMIANQDKIR